MLDFSDELMNELAICYSNIYYSVKSSLETYVKIIYPVIQKYGQITYSVAEKYGHICKSRLNDSEYAFIIKYLSSVKLILFQNILNIYAVLSFIYAWIVTKYNIYSNKLFVWGLINLPEEFWRALWYEQSKPKYTNPEFKYMGTIIRGNKLDIPFKLKWLIYYNLYMIEETIMLRTVDIEKFIRSLPEDSYITLEAHKYLTFVLLYKIDNSIGCLRINFNERKIKLNNNDERSLLFNRVKL
jgi:hypothetical protein